MDMIDKAKRKSPLKMTNSFGETNNSENDDEDYVPEFKTLKQKNPLNKPVVSFFYR